MSDHFDALGDIQGAVNVAHDVLDMAHDVLLEIGRSDVNPMVWHRLSRVSACLFLVNDSLKETAKRCDDVSVLPT